MCLITVFTPTYNRDKLIYNLFQSLEKQDSKDFEWLIVDDGSTDNTATIIQKCKSISSFPIRYYYKKNEGKHIAINFAAERAKGEWFFIVDSDDILTSNSISRIKYYCNQIKDNNNFAGVAGRKGFLDTNKVIGNKQKKLIIDSTNAEFRKKNRGDHAEIVRTSILINHRFPQFADEKFMQESVLWYGLSNEGYLFRWFNEIIYLANYLEDGLTKNGKLISKSSPLSKSYAENQLVGSKNVSFKQRLKSSINYYRYGLYGGNSLKQLYCNANKKMLGIFAVPIAVCMKIK